MINTYAPRDKLEFELYLPERFGILISFSELVFTLLILINKYQ
jgi:hypothetical protein